MKKHISLAAAALMTVGALGAQTSQGAAQPGKPSAYGNSSQGTARPADDPILSNGSSDETVSPAAAPTAQPTPTAPSQAYTAPVKAANPDAGIVEVPVPDETAAPASTQPRPALKTHIYNPDADIVTSVPMVPNQLPQGTPFHARLVEQISADTVTPGTPFTAQLTMDVIHMGRTVIPAGSYIHGRVTDVSAGRRIGGQSVIRLTPDEVVLPDSTHYRFRGIVTQTAGSNTKTDAEGYVVNREHAGRTAAEYGMTAGSGAVIGAVVAGPVGAGVGGAIGAGVMTVHWLRERNAAVLPAGSHVTFGLSSALELTPSAIVAGSTPTMSQAEAPSATGTPASTYVEPKVVN